MAEYGHGCLLFNAPVGTAQFLEHHHFWQKMINLDFLTFDAVENCPIWQKIDLRETESSTVSRKTSFLSFMKLHSSLTSTKIRKRKMKAFHP